MKKISVFILLLISIQSFSQEKNYFFDIKDSEDNYSENAVISRFLHAVGFRYYWATEGLNENDLKYKPSDTGISTRATLEHIYTLSIIINSGMKDIKVERLESYPELSFKDLRENTWSNIFEYIIRIIPGVYKHRYENKEVTFTINSKGFRGKEFSLKKKSI